MNSIHFGGKIKPLTTPVWYQDNKPNQVLQVKIDELILNGLLVDSGKNDALKLYVLTSVSVLQHKKYVCESIFNKRAMTFFLPKQKRRYQKISPFQTCYRKVLKILTTTHNRKQHTRRNR